MDETKVSRIIALSFFISKKCRKTIAVQIAFEINDIENGPTIWLFFEHDKNIEGFKWLFFS